MKDVDGLRGGEVRRYGSRVLVSDIPECELTAPTHELIAAVKAHDHQKIAQLTNDRSNP